MVFQYQNAVTLTDSTTAKMAAIYIKKNITPRFLKVSPELR